MALATRSVGGRLLAEVAAFTRNHPEVQVTPPWETASGCRWEVEVGGMSSEATRP
jgi:hypothetical protein